MRRLLLCAAAIVSLAQTAHASEPKTAILNVSARVISHCAIDMRSANGEASAPLDLRCGDAMPVRVETTPVQTVTTGDDENRFVVTTLNF
jgi:hypothetical protein